MSESYTCKICQATGNVDEQSTLHITHEIWCIQCEICEKQFIKGDIFTYKLDRAFLACETCGLQESVSYYRMSYESSRNAVDSLKQQLNLFKSVMLRPETMSAIASDPLSDQPSLSTIRQRLSGIEHFTIDQLQFWLETYEIYAREIAGILGKKASKEEIKQHLAAKTKKALEDTAARKVKADSVESKPRVKLSPEDKAVQAMMKSLHLSESAAKTMLESSLNAMRGKN